MVEIFVPLYSLRYVESYSSMTPAQARTVVDNYLSRELEIHVWKDCVVQGRTVVKALRLIEWSAEVLVHVRNQLPIHEYPGDLP